MSKFIYSCFLLVKNVSRDSGEILLSPWQRGGHYFYSPVNSKSTEPHGAMSGKR